VKRIYLAVISVLVAAYGGCMVYFRYFAYDSTKGLFDEGILLPISEVILVLLILSILILSFKLYKNRFWKSNLKDSEKEESTDTRVHALVRRNYQKGQLVFFVASWMIFLASSIFRLIVFISERTAFNGLLFLVSIGLLWGIARSVLINLLDQTKAYDSVVLLLPTLYAALFAIYQYRQLAVVPQLPFCYAEVLTMLLSLLAFFLYASHFFGRGGAGIMLFIALALTACGAVTYIYQMASFAGDVFANRAFAEVSIFKNIAGILYYAAAALFGGVYSSILMNNSYSFLKRN